MINLEKSPVHSQKETRLVPCGNERFLKGTERLAFWMVLMKAALVNNVVVASGLGHSETQIQTAPTHSTVKVGSIARAIQDIQDRSAT